MASKTGHASRRLLDNLEAQPDRHVFQMRSAHRHGFRGGRRAADDVL
jgi:hypothetical protein